MKNRSSLLVEILWISIGVVSLYLFLREIIGKDIREAGMFLLMSIISFLLAWFRHNQRKKS